MSAATQAYSYAPPRLFTRKRELRDGQRVVATVGPIGSRSCVVVLGGDQATWALQVKRRFGLFGGQFIHAKLVDAQGDLATLQSSEGQDARVEWKDGRTWHWITKSRVPSIAADLRDERGDILRYGRAKGSVTAATVQVERAGLSETEIAALVALYDAFQASEATSFRLVPSFG